MVDAVDDNEFDIKDVIRRDLCIGCGVCDVATDGRVRVAIAPYGLYKASLNGSKAHDLAKASRVCPMSDSGKHENELSKELFGSQKFDERVGHFHEVFFGRINDETKVRDSSSGGLTTLLLEKLLGSQEVNGVIHVSASKSGEHEYRISETIEQVLEGRKSAYTATTLKSVLKTIKGNNKTYVLVGIPCFIKAVRRLLEQDEVLKKQIRFMVGLLCGHLKSKNFSKSLAWQAGVAPHELDSVDYRVKDSTRRASDYSFEARSKEGFVKSIRMNEAFDGSWGYAAFQPEGCNFCDDVFAETADIVFGDAWNPKYTKDWRGTNVIVSRNALLTKLLRTAADAGEVTLESSTPREAAETQAGNFRHRQVGIQARLADDLRLGEVVPNKRFLPGYSNHSRKRLALVRMRRSFSRDSHIYFERAIQEGSLRSYQVWFMKRARKYDFLSALDRGIVGVLKYFAKRTVSMIKDLRLFLLGR